MSQTGERIAVIEDDLQYSFECTADQRLLCSIGKMPMLWELKTGECLAEIPGGNETEPEAFGTYDPVSGLRSSEAVCCGKVVYEYRPEAVPVPDGLDEQILLAKELLGDRVLSRIERNTYHLQSAAAD